VAVAVIDDEFATASRIAPIEIDIVVRLRRHAAPIRGWRIYGMLERGRGSVRDITD
jgi:hypothetical protein